jgi:hypothetical protein
MRPAGSRLRRTLLLASGVLVCAILFFSTISSGIAAIPQEAASSSDLQSLLDRSAEYCDRLSRTVLYFVCHERIDEWFYPAAWSVVKVGDRTVSSVRREEYHYVYDYQLVRDRGGLIQESRTLLEEQGKKVKIPDAPLKTHIFKHANVVMGPLGLLSRNRQADFKYRVVR